MRKTLIFLFSLMIVLPAYAQQPPKEKVKEIRQAVQQEIKQIKTTAVQNVAEARNALQQEIEKRKTEFKDMVDAQRIEVKKRIEEKRTALKEELKKIKDERKKTIVENVDMRLDALNEQKTTQYAHALDQMETVLLRITDRMNQAEAKGDNVAAVKAAITSAKSAIASARSAVATQAGKTYTITVTTDATLHSDVKKAREALHGDLTIVFAAVKDARDAVHTAAVTLAQITKSEEGKTATSSEH